MNNHKLESRTNNYLRDRVTILTGFHVFLVFLNKEIQRSVELQEGKLKARGKPANRLMPDFSLAKFLE